MHIDTRVVREIQCIHVKILSILLLLWLNWNQCSVLDSNILRLQETRAYHNYVQFLVSSDWVSKQCFTSSPTQYRLYGRRFYRSKDPTNSIKVLKEMLQKRKKTTKTTKYRYTLWVKKTGPLFYSHNYGNIEQIFTKLGTNHALFMLNIMP